MFKDSPGLQLRVGDSDMLHVSLQSILQSHNKLASSNMESFSGTLLSCMSPKNLWIFFFMAAEAEIQNICHILSRTFNWNHAEGSGVILLLDTFCFPT